MLCGPTIMKESDKVNWGKQNLYGKCITLLFISLIICITMFACIASYLTTRDANGNYEEVTVISTEDYDV